MLPRSRGSVRLASAEPGTPPLIDPNYYADARDLEIFAAGLRATREIGRAAALDQWRGEEVLPGPGVTDDASLHAYLRRNLKTYAHPGGTCRIGADRDAVVDADLRVHGISGLRVADASVMPSAPSANTNATVYAIAERAASLIQAQS
jgi:choline dehydrogenase